MNDDTKNSRSQKKVEKHQEVTGIQTSYQTHVQDIGWQGIKYDGEEAGTSGQIEDGNPLYSGSIEYQTNGQEKWTK